MFVCHCFWLVVSNIFKCSPRTLGKWSNLTSIFFQMGWFNHQPGLFSLMVGLMGVNLIAHPKASVVERASKDVSHATIFLFWDVWTGCPVSKWNENSDLVANGSSPKKKIEFVKQSFNHQWWFCEAYWEQEMGATDSFHIPWVHPCPIQSTGARQGQLSLLSKRLTMLREEHEAIKTWCCFVMRKGARDDVFFPYYPPSKWHIPIPRHVWRWFFLFSRWDMSVPGG